MKLNSMKTYQLQTVCVVMLFPERIVVVLHRWCCCVLAATENSKHTNQNSTKLCSEDLIRYYQKITAININLISVRLTLIVLGKCWDRETNELTLY